MGLKLNGATSGSIEIDVPAVAGTDTAITIPATTGGEFIVSDSSGNIDLGPLDINGGAADNSVNIDGSGRLLVGTSSAPSAGSGQYSRLVIQGFIGNNAGEGYASLARGASATSTASGDALGVLNFTDNAGATFGQIACVADATPGTDDYPGRLVFSTTADSASSPTERMRINSDGMIYGYTGGIAITRTVNSAAAVGSFINSSATTGNQYGVFIRLDGDPNNVSQYFLDCYGSTTQRARIYSNGGIGNYQSNDNNLCDEREKKNIEPLDSTWSCLKNWSVKKFHYNEDADTDNKRYGVIAQQIAEHCPEVISDWVKQKAEDAVLDEDGNVVTPAREEILRMGVREQQMMWMAIKALQEAQTRIETLEAKVAQLEGGAA